MRLHCGADAWVAQWVSERIPHMNGESFGPCAAIAVLSDDGRMMGGVVYHNYVQRFGQIEMSAAATSKHWLTPEVLRGIFRYPFVQLRCRRVMMVTSERNKEARRLLQRLGFAKEGTLRRMFSANNDAILYGLLVSEYHRSPFFKERGQHLGQASA